MFLFQVEVVAQEKVQKVTTKFKPQILQLLIVQLDSIKKMKAVIVATEKNEISIPILKSILMEKKK
jgi:hypothetical protein